MKVLTVVAVMGAGGAEVVADVVVRERRARGDEVVLASGGGFRAVALAADGVPHVPLRLDGRRPLDLLRSAWALRRAHARLRPDVVHAHNVKATCLARLAAGPRATVLTTMHGVPEAEARTAARLLRVTATHVVAVSEHVARTLREHGVPAARLSVVENAVAPITTVDRGAARRTLGIDDSRPVALVLARLAAQKRHDLLVEAWSAVQGDALLLVAGDGPRRATLQEQARRGDAGGRICFLGERVDVDRLLGACDLLVLPTDWEGLPISLLEALGAGVPSVVSDVGGVEPLAAGLHLVPPGSAEALAHAVNHLLDDDTARLDLAARGRRLVRDRFDPARMHAAYADLYARLTDDIAAPTRPEGSR